jgi:Glycosyltransferase family 87
VVDEAAARPMLCGHGDTREQRRSAAMAQSLADPATSGRVRRGVASLRAIIDKGRRRDASETGLTIAGLLFAVYLFVVVAPRAGTVGFDALSYWAYSIEDPYRIPHGTLGSFVYSPVAARLFEPASTLPWLTFLWLWLALLLGTALWLGGRRWLWVLAFPPVAVELYHGNVHLLMAAAIALGFRYPAAWAFVLLTKVTPGIGLIWFAARREWRNLALALGMTGLLVAASVLIDSQLWPAWIDKELLLSLRHTPDQPQLPVPLLVRLPLAAAVALWGARTNRRWTVPVAATLALPVLWFSGLSILAAIPAVSRRELRERSALLVPAAE